MDKILSEEEYASYARDGYVFVRGLFNAQETAAINAAVNSDPAIAASVLGLAARAGGTTDNARWRSLDDDIFGAVSR